MKICRRAFLVGAGATIGGAAAPFAGRAAEGSGILFGVCCSLPSVKLVKSAGYDFWEGNVAEALGPDKGDEWWKGQLEKLRSAALPLRSCAGFIPGRFRLTGPNADFEPALKYGERALRRAEEAGLSVVVFGSGGARNVPGDFTTQNKPDLEKGLSQYAEFCRLLCERVSDLKKVVVAVEPLRPNESNILNFVWQGAAVCRKVASPRIGITADIFHMQMGGESAKSIVEAAQFVRHCHIATYGTRQFPGHDRAEAEKFRPYFGALKSIGYCGGVSCECSWGEKGDYARNLEISLKTMKGMI